MTEILAGHGYAGSERVVRRRLAELRPPAVRPAQRTGYLPGQLAQVDWGEMASRPRILGAERRICALVMTLPCSGAQTAHFSFDMSLEAFLEGHVAAFDYFGGVPGEVVYDNLRAVVARREGERVVWAARLTHLRGHYAFAAHACTPGAPREKGSVEAGVRYLKSGFWPARRIADLPTCRPSTPTGATGWPTGASMRPSASGSMSAWPRSVPPCARFRPWPSIPPAGGRAACRSTVTSSTPAPSTVLRPSWCTSAWSCAFPAMRSGSATAAPRSTATRAATRRHLAAGADPAPSGAATAGPGAPGADRRRPARARRLRRALSVSAGGDRLPYLVAKLEAPRIGERLATTAERARAEGWAYQAFLEALLEAEVFARDASGARQRIRSAGFPALKSLEDFDWAAQPSAERPLVEHLAGLTWIPEAANVCFLGPPDTGKTHLAIALAIRACQAGHRVAFATAADRVPRLEAAQERNWSCLAVADTDFKPRHQPSRIRRGCGSRDAPGSVRG